MPSLDSSQQSRSLDGLGCFSFFVYLGFMVIRVAIGRKESLILCVSGGRWGMLTSWLGRYFWMSARLVGHEFK